MAPATLQDRDRLGPLAGLVRHRPVTTFVVLAFALSWGCWLAAAATGSGVAFFLGGLGPAAAAAVVAWRLGTLRSWLEHMTRWRVPPRYYLFAVGFPFLLYGVPNGLVALAGGDPAPLALDERVPAYAGTWLAALFLGGLEEPGWRGFALPRLQQRLTPVRATIVLGVVWGLWHLPVAPLAIVVTLPLAFLYTWLWNRTGSALLCIILHASITPAQDHLGLVADGPAVDLAIGLALVTAAAGAVVLTRGGLGLPSQEQPTAADPAR